MTVQYTVIVNATVHVHVCEAARTKCLASRCLVASVSGVIVEGWRQSHHPVDLRCVV